MMNVQPPKWHIYVLISLVLLLIAIPVSTWPYTHSCQEQGKLRLPFSVTEESEPKGRTAFGYLTGTEDFGLGRASQYRADRYKIVLYAKTDFWYNTPVDKPGKPAETGLRSDCSWQLQDFHEGEYFAAFLVAPDYEQPAQITNTSNALPLIVDGKQVVWGSLWGANIIQEDNIAVNKSLDWLVQQTTPNEIIPQPLAQRANLVVSYRIPADDELYSILYSRSWIPDNALAAIAMTTADQMGQATVILDAVTGQIEGNGRIAFVFKTDDEWYFENYRTDAIAWVGYAFTFYQQKSGDPRYQPEAEKIARYLLGLQDLDADSDSYGSLDRDPDVSEPKYVTADNIIAYFFLRDLNRLTGNARYHEAAERIQASLMNHHWNVEQNRFDQELHTKSELFLETAALGSVFLHAVGEPEKAQSSLAFVTDTYQPVAESPLRYGYAPYEDRRTVWLPGSLEMALAYERLGNSSLSQAIMEEISQIQTNSGGLPYAIPKATVLTEETYHTWPSVASTAWFIIVQLDEELFLAP